MRFTKRQPSCLLVTLIAIVCFTPPAWAGAWTVPRNRWYVEYFHRYFGSKKEFDAHRNTSRRLKSASFRDIRNEAKLEYGLADGFNLLVSAPYQSSHYQDRNTDLLTTGVGDISVRTKLRLLEEPVVSSVQFSWKIPGGYNPNESPALGDGQMDFESRLQLSRSWVFNPSQVPVRRKAAPPSAREEAIRRAVMVAQQQRQDEETAPPMVETPAEETIEMETRYGRVAFVNVEGGFTVRDSDPANEFPLVAEAGFTLFRRLMLVGSVESVFSVKHTNESVEDFSKWGLRGILNVWGEGFASVFRGGGPTVNVELGYNDIFAGRNTADAFEVFGKVGVFF